MLSSQVGQRIVPVAVAAVLADQDLRLTPEKFVSHRFSFEAIIDAYDTFGRAAETKALKVAITR
jgi:threonine dehydrogenase-like Zn-dependent dehydrogenase